MGKLPLIMYRCIFMFLLLCTSCVEQKDTTSIKIDLMATDSDTLYYSSFVDSLSYIPLETKDDCLIREITDDQSIHLHFRHPTTVRLDI